MNMIVDRPEDFLRFMHPVKFNGHIILQRPEGNKILRSRVDPRQLEPVARIAYGLPNIFMSVASYLGRPLILNFEKTNCLYIQFPNLVPEDKNHIYEIQQHIWKKKLPLPNLIIYDGENVECLWHLSTPYTSQDIFKFIICQRLLLKTLSDFYVLPTQKSISASHTIRLVGTVNSETKENVHVRTFDKEPIDNKKIEEAIFDSISHTEFESIKESALCLMDLQMLFREKLFQIKSSPNSNINWILFFAAALSKLCLKSDLKLELQALAESLENKQWKNIDIDFKKQVLEIAETASTGLIVVNDSQFDISQPHWKQIAANLLEVTKEEARRLSLKKIVPEDFIPLATSQDISRFADIFHNEAFGYEVLLPITNLLNKAA